MGEGRERERERERERDRHAVWVRYWYGNWYCVGGDCGYPEWMEPGTVRYDTVTSSRNAGHSLA